MYCYLWRNTECVACIEREVGLGVKYLTHPPRPQQYHITLSFSYIKDLFYYMDLGYNLMGQALRKS